MQRDDDEAGRVVLPSDPFWLLNVRVKEGESTSFAAQMLYAYQWRWGSFAKQSDTPPLEQADGTP